jgi:hypothetical protein
MTCATLWSKAKYNLRCTLSFHHKAGGLDELRRFEKYGDEMWECHSIIEIQCVADILNLIIGIVEIEEVEEGCAILV